MKVKCEGFPKQKIAFLSQLQIWSFRQLVVLTTDLLSCAESPRWFVIL